MPTGLTAPIHDNKQDFTFRDFAWRCARHIGYLMHMRDEPMDAPIPDEIPLNSWHKEELDGAQKRLAEVVAMTPEQATAAAKEQHAKDLEYYRKRVQEAEELKRRYYAMQAEVMKWEPPTPDHSGLKALMLEQLRTSIDGDCVVYTSLPHAPLSGDSWHERMIERLREEVAYHERELERQITQNKSANAWLRALRESLK